MRKIRFFVYTLLIVCLALVFASCDLSGSLVSPTVETAKPGSSETEGSNATVKGSEAKLVAAEGFEIVENDLSVSVPNNTEVFSFLNKITVSEGATWAVSIDEFGLYPSLTKSVPLEIGDNVFYLIIVSGDSNTVSNYIVTIRRRPFYTVSFETSGGTEYEPVSVEEDSLLSAPADPVRNGYSFAGWAYDFGTPVTDDLTVSANWMATEYVVNYELNGGVNAESNPATYTVEDTITLAVPTREFYAFAGWSDDGVIDVGSMGDKTFTASWTPIDYPILYDLGGGINNESNPTTYTVEDTVTLADPQRAGYTFVSWSDDGVISVGSTGDKIFTAIWSEPIVYTVSYVLNDGTNAESNPATYTVEDAITLALPERFGYTFAGWSDGGVIAVGSTGDKTFTASWTLTDYPIVYDLCGGTNNESNPVTYTMEDAVTLSAPQKAGYNFIGWSDDGVISVGSTGVKTFTAIWSEPIVYTVTYDTDGGEGVENPVTYVITDDVELNEPTRENYAFLGWFTVEGVKITNLQGCCEALALTARWKRNGEGLRFQTNGDGTCIVAAIGTNVDIDLIVPATSPDGDTVVGIGDSAFAGCARLVTVSFPDSVASIGSRAFYGCSSLTGIVIPEQITIIESKTFYRCESLTDVTIGTGVTVIGNSAFYGCKKLTEIVLPNGLLSIGGYAFYGCSCITNLVVPNSVTEIGYAAFSGCSGVEAISLPEGALTTDRWEAIGPVVADLPQERRSFRIELDGFSVSEKTAKNDVFLAGPDSIVPGVTPYIQQLVYERNQNASLLLGTSIDYVYWNDLTWSEQSSRIVAMVQGQAADAPDLFVNMVFDLNLALLNAGAFKDVWSIQDSFFEFNAAGWLSEWMESLSFTGDRAYILAGDYFLDIIRCMGVLPLNVTLMDANAVKLATALFGEALGEGEKMSQRFFDYVEEGNWTWDALGKLCEAIWIDTDGSGTNSIGDTLGIVTDRYYAMPAQLILFSTGEELTESYKISDPSDANYGKTWIKFKEDATTVGKIFDAVKGVFGGQGAYVTCDISSGSTVENPGIAYHQIKFSENTLLFAGPSLLGALENDTFQQMVSTYSVVPLPKVDAANEYNTIVHNTADAGAINVNTTPEKARVISAHLQYCTENSVEIREEYFSTVTRTATAYVSGTVRMISLIYDNVGNGRDKAIEDASMRKSADRFHGKMKDNAFVWGSAEVASWYVNARSAKQARIDEVLSKWYTLPKDEEHSCPPSDHIHTWSTSYTVDVEPTCIAVGLKSYHCTLCGRSNPDSVVTIPATGVHIWSEEYTEDILPNCTTSGTQSHHCIMCDAIQPGSEVEAPPRHTWEYVVDVQPTCVTTGSKSYHCTVCGATIPSSAVSIPATGVHVWDDVYTIDVAPTCTTPGSKSYHCTVCDMIQYSSRTQVPTVAHSWASEYTVDTQPTCTTVGYKSKHCTRCNQINTLTIVEIPVADHPWAEEYTIDAAPTCTASGYKSKHCTVCDQINTLSIVVLPATGHNWAEEYTVDVAPTCTTTGSKFYHCTVCGAIQPDSEVEIPNDPNAHVVENWIVAVPATIFEDGRRQGECVNCGGLVEETYYAASTEWKYTTESTDALSKSKNFGSEVLTDGKHFYPTDENPNGLDLHIEFSFLWNDSLLRLSNSRDQVLEGEIGNQNAYWMSLTNNAKGSDGIYAGGFEYSALRTVEYGPAGMSRQTANGNNVGTEYSDFPNIGGSDQANPEWGWHRVAFVVHEELLNANALKADTYANATAAEYLITFTCYVDGVKLYTLSNRSDPAFMASNYRAENMLFTATSDGAGGIIYADISANKNVTWIWIRTYQTTEGVACAVYADEAIFAGNDFAQNVVKVDNPADNVYTTADGAEIPAKIWYRLAD